MKLTPVVLVPALGSDDRLWQRVVDLLMDSDREILIIRPQGSSISAMADSLLDRAPKEFILAGISMGGYVALEIVLRNTGRVKGLALCNTSAIAPPAERRQSSLELIDLARTGLFTEAVNRTSGGVARGKPEVIDVAAAMALALGPEIFIEQQEAVLGRRDRQHELGSIEVSTLVVGGQEDAITPPVLSEQLATEIRGAELHIIPDCGHLSPLEQPERVAQLFSAWLRTLQ